MEWSKDLIGLWRWSCPSSQITIRDWDLHLPFLVMAYLSADHDSAGCSPSKMMLGREIQLPIDLMFGRPEEPHQGASDYAHALQEKMEK